MAITYTNNIYTYIIKPLEDLIQAEFIQVKISYEEHSGTKSFLITPNGDTLVELRGHGQVRQYGVIVSYGFRKGGRYSRVDQYKHLTEIGERFKRLIWNYTDGTNWFDGKCDDIRYEQDEDDMELFKAIIDCSFSREEVI